MPACLSTRRACLKDVPFLDDHAYSMDLRSQLRLETNEPVHVTVLGECETKLLGRIINYSSHGMSLSIAKPVPVGAAVKIEWSHTLLLGEVIDCRRDEDGYAIGLELEHALYNTAELAKLAKRILDEAAPQPGTPEVNVEEPS